MSLRPHPQHPPQHPHHHRDAHQRPPASLKALYKKYRNISPSALRDDQDVIDFSRPRHEHGGASFGRLLSPVRTVQSSMLAFSPPVPLQPPYREVQVYEHAALPGFHLVPSLLNDHVQTELLSRLLHRDLADGRHNTNISKHYALPYHLCHESLDRRESDDGAGYGRRRPSFFNCSPESDLTLDPFDPGMHKPIGIRQFLDKKLRWITLGGQYDWTDKAYPDTEPPSFPQDVAALVQGAFPDMTPQAAIVNVYTPGDALSLHRDVSEEANKGLVSISIGCDALFLVGLAANDDDDGEHLVVRLRSGDAVYMSGPSRYAWHGVPLIIPDTCPPGISIWPAPAEQAHDGSRYEAWRGWMATKRVNLNVRQMQA